MLNSIKSNSGQLNESTHKHAPESLMTWMLLAAPSCRSASSCFCRQVAVTVVSVSEYSWLKEAEKEKFPSPTSNMDREGDMSSATRNVSTHKNWVCWKAAPKIYSPSTAIVKTRDACRSDKNHPRSSSQSNMMILLHILWSNVHIVCLTLSHVNKASYTDCTAKWRRWPSAAVHESWTIISHL